jgi:hypothetical protein
VSAAVDQLVRKLAPETERAVRRPRFSEDALVRALDHCDEAGLRLGQFVISAVTEGLVETGAITNNMANSDRLSIVERTVFYIENGALEQAMRTLIAKRQQEVRDLVA